ncbi:hypothetical protein BJX76DRAFT_321934 [Aspergillus varians]
MLKFYPKSLDLLLSVTAFICFEEEMSRPRSLPALRMKAVLPNGEQVDNSQYKIMRPGVMLSSGKHPDGDSESLTSSGVLVKDNLGVECVTVAAHGFLGSPFDEKVYHPSHTGDRIGEVVKELAHTGVGLVRLDEDIDFTNEPFENTIILTPPFKFAGFSRATETRIGEHSRVFLKALDRHTLFSVFLATIHLNRSKNGFVVNGIIWDKARTR